MGALLTAGSNAFLLFSIAVLGFTYFDFWRQRAKKVRALKLLFDTKSPALAPGHVVLSGVVKPRKSSSTGSRVIEGRAMSEVVQNGRSHLWERVETVVDGKSFDLLTEAGEKVRVELGKKARFRLETDARETNEPKRRVVEYELREGDEVWVEGTLSRNKARGQGYRDGTGWIIRGDVEPTVLRTRGAIQAHQRTNISPPLLSALGLALMALCAYGAVDLAIVESSMVDAEGVATVKEVERRDRKGNRFTGHDMTVRIEEGGHVKVCGPIRGDGVANGDRVAVRYSLTDRDRCLRAGSYGRGDIEFVYFIASLLLLSGAIATFLSRRSWIGANPWFERAN